MSKKRVLVNARTAKDAGKYVQFDVDLPGDILPEYSAEDEGKSPIVKKSISYVKGDALYPTQVLEADPVLSSFVSTPQNINKELLLSIEDGTDVYVILDDIKVVGNAQVAEYDDLRTITIDIYNLLRIVYNIHISEEDDGSISISADSWGGTLPESVTSGLYLAEEVETLGIDYESSAYNYDIVFVSNHAGSNGSPSTSNTSIVKGSIEEIEAKVLDGIPIRGIFYEVHKWNDPRTGARLGFISLYELSTFEQSYKSIYFTRAHTPNGTKYTTTIYIIYDASTYSFEIESII